MRAFTRSEFEQAERECLHRGRWGNADVWRVGLRGQWVVKDFRKFVVPLRWTFGVWMAWREYRVLQRLAGSPGIPGASFLMDRFAMCESFFAGRPLRAVAAGEIPPSFFESLEAAVQAMHARGIVHLDLRNAGNILVDAAGKPVLLDFQSAMGSRWLPGPWRRRLEWVDLSGVYKHWLRLAPGTMGEARERVLLWQVRNRKWWRIRGYRFSLSQRSLKARERALLDKYRGS